MKMVNMVLSCSSHLKTQSYDAAKKENSIPFLQFSLPSPVDSIKQITKNLSLENKHLKFFRTDKDVLLCAPFSKKPEMLFVNV